MLTQLPLEFKNRSPNWQSEPVLRQEYLMSLVIGITPHNFLIFVVSDILMDPVFGEILQEFSIEQGVIDTKTEP